MDTDRDVTPDPDLVTEETNPTPDKPEDRSEGEQDLEAFEDFAGEPVPAEDGGPLP